jgi:hypothetical protein
MMLNDESMGEFCSTSVEHKVWHRGLYEAGMQCATMSAQGQLGIAFDERGRGFKLSGCNCPLRRSVNGKLGSSLHYLLTVLSDSLLGPL